MRLTEILTLRLDAQGRALLEAAAHVERVPPSVLLRDLAVRGSAAILARTGNAALGRPTDEMRS